MTETFHGLLPFRWRDIDMPLTRIRMSIAHDLVEHKSWGVDSARVENTGQAPVKITATIPFINSIAPAQNEKWLSGDLYPTLFRKFLLAFQDKRTGLVNHPEFGGIACRPHTLEVELVGDQRSGVIVEASWVETLDDEVRHKVENGIVNLDVAAVSFDTKDIDLREIVPALPKYATTLEDLARKVQAVGDQTALLANRSAGQINRIKYRVDLAQRSIDRAKSALTWPATRDIERIKSATIELRAKLLQANRDIAIYHVPNPTTVAGLLPSLPGANLGDVVKLNPRLMARPIVEAGEMVRYYLPKVA